MYENNQEEILDTTLGSKREYTHLEEEYHETTRVKSPIVLPLVFSLILMMFSLANPFLTDFANNLQSQNLYASWAIGQGQMMYSGFFGTSGLLYYGIAALSSWLANLVNVGSPASFMGIFYFIFLWFSGREAFQISHYITQNKKLSLELVSVFYVLIFILGFGGFYSSLFALPFVLKASLLVARYTGLEEMRDEYFLLYGALAALGFMFDPLSTTTFYLVAFIILFFFNIIQKRKARGFYQLLASLLGFSLVFYPIGYYTVWVGSFGEAITQATYPLNSLSFSHENFLRNFIFYGLLFLILGFVSSWIINLARLTRKTLLPIRFLATLGLLLALVLLVASPEQGAYQVLLYLPFILILLAVWLEGRVQGRQAGRHGRRSRNASSAVKKYFTGTLFLPVLALAYLVIYPIIDTTILSQTRTRERYSLAQYIKDNTKKTDKIYVWDNTSSLYQMSQRLSASPILSPAIYQGTEENKIVLANSLSSANPTFILVNQDVPVTKTVQELLDQDYQTVDLNTEHFKLYQLK